MNLPTLDIILESMRIQRQSSPYSHSSQSPTRVPPNQQILVHEPNRNLDINIQQNYSQADFEYSFLIKNSLPSQFSQDLKNSKIAHSQLNSTQNSPNQYRDNLSNHNQIKSMMEYNKQSLRDSAFSIKDQQIKKNQQGTQTSRAIQQDKHIQTTGMVTRTQVCQHQSDYHHKQNQTEQAKDKYHDRQNQTENYENQNMTRITQEKLLQPQHLQKSLRDRQNQTDNFEKVSKYCQHQDIHNHKQIQTDSNPEKFSKSCQHQNNYHHKQIQTDNLDTICDNQKIQNKLSSKSKKPELTIQLDNQNTEELNFSQSAFMKMIQRNDSIIYDNFKDLAKYEEVKDFLEFISKKIDQVTKGLGDWTMENNQIFGRVNLMIGLYQEIVTQIQNLSNSFVQQNEIRQKIPQNTYKSFKMSELYEHEPPVQLDQTLSLSYQPDKQIKKQRSIYESVRIAPSDHNEFKLKKQKDNEQILQSVVMSQLMTQEVQNYGYVPDLMKDDDDDEIYSKKILSDQTSEDNDSEY